MGSKKEFGQRVRELRGERSQQAVAALMRHKLGHGWHQTSVAKIESGNRVVQATEVADLAQSLGCSVHALLGLPEVTDSDAAIRELEQASVAICELNEAVRDRIQAIEANL